MSTTRERRNTMAQPMVMRSRFFSMMLVPVWVEYMELAIISEMPVPLPECMRMKMIRPKPEMTSRIRKMMTRGFKTMPFFQLPLNVHASY